MKRLVFVPALSHFVVSLFVVACGRPAAIAVAPAPKTARPPPASTSLAAPRPGSNVRVHVEGVKEVSAAELASVVEIDRPERNVGVSNRDVLERDTLLVTAALYDRGYVQCKVEEPLVAIAADGVIDVTFRVEEGLRFRLSKLETEEMDARTNKLVTPMKQPTHSKIGEWFSRQLLVNDIQAIQTTYRDAGYGMADVTPETAIDKDARTIDVKIVIRRGPIVTYHDVRIDPPDALVAADAAKRIGVMPGARYSETKLGQIKAELATKGVRADVVTKEVRGQPDAIDVTIEVH